jgi:Flp pilus assembly protein TadG
MADRRWRAEDGNTLILMPVGVLVLLVLGAIAVDSAVMFSAQREVATVAAGLANDVAGAIDERRVFDEGRFVIDPARAEQLVATVLANRGDDIRCAVAVDEDRVQVACEDPAVRLVFAPALQAIPGVTGTVTVRGVSAARAAAGPG